MGKTVNNRPEPLDLDAVLSITIAVGYHTFQFGKVDLLAAADEEFQFVRTKQVNSISIAHLSNKNNVIQTFSENIQRFLMYSLSFISSFTIHIWLTVITYIWEDFSNGLNFIPRYEFMPRLWTRPRARHK